MESRFIDEGLVSNVYGEVFIVDIEKIILRFYWIKGLNVVVFVCNREIGY